MGEVEVDSCFETYHTLPDLPVIIPSSRMNGNHQGTASIESATSLTGLGFLFGIGVRKPF